MAEQASDRLIMRATPEQCLAVVTDFERYPEWAADVKAVIVDERDDEGRAVEVAFRAAAFGRSTSYTLHYDYTSAPRELSWVQVLGDVFGRPLGGDPTCITGTLYGQQLDATEQLEDVWGEVQQYLADVIGWAGLTAIEAEELSVVPGLDEVFALADIKAHADSGAWAVIV